MDEAGSIDPSLSDLSRTSSAGGRGNEYGLGKESSNPETNVSAFCAKVIARTAEVGVIGLGYVGLPLSLLSAREGFQTTGFDIDPGKMAKLQRGVSYIKHISDASVAEQIGKKQFQATDDFTRLQKMDAIIICVPTPLDKHREPDLSFVRNTAEVVSAHLQPGQLIVLESTTYPGTTDEEVLPILERKALRCPVSPYTTDGATVSTINALEPDFFLALLPGARGSWQ